MRPNDYVVINRAATGNLVAVVVRAYSMQEAVNLREQVLVKGGHRCEIIAVTESIPGPYGTGGRVLRKVTDNPRPMFHVTSQRLSEL